MIFLKANFMKKILFFILLYTHLTFVFAQKDCQIIYKIEATEDFFEKEDPDMHGYDKKINEAIKNHASNFSFLLKINGDESYFQSVKTMSNDNDDLNYKLASAILQSNLKYYLNVSTREKLTEVEAYGKKFIILDSINDWEITKEQKKIGNYTCYKAVTKKVSLNNEGTFISDIIVWFTTDLPYSFGPIGYGGLPGLILELQDGTIKYKLEKIKYLNKLKITKPVKGELVTDKELLEIGKKATEIRG